jgi:ribokinase
MRQASAVVMQLEVPHETVRHAIQMCRSLGIFTILDPAPARPLERAMLGVDLLSPNQGEAGMLLGLGPSPRVRRKRRPDAKQIGGDLLARSGARVVVLKLGARGAMILGPSDRIERVRPFKVKVVDTTAAGDAFTAALAIGRTEGMSLKDSVCFANAAGAICCRTFGAQPALPAREAVERLMDAAT